MYLVLNHELPPDFRVLSISAASLNYLFKPPYASGSVSSLSGEASGYDGVHCQESAGTGSVILKVVPVTGAAFASPWTN